jgi:hypothetical protein
MFFDSFVNGGIPIEEVIQDVYGKIVVVFVLDNFIAALPEKYCCRLCNGIQLGNSIFLISSSAANSFILEDDKEAACNCFLGTNLTNKIGIVLLEYTASLVSFICNFLLDLVKMSVYVRFLGEYLELNFRGADLEVGHKGVDDIPLFTGTAEKEVDWGHLDDFDKSMITGVNDPVAYIFDGKILRYGIL